MTGADNDYAKPDMDASGAVEGHVMAERIQEKETGGKMK